VELWSTQTAQQALMRLAGGPQHTHARIGKKNREARRRATAQRRIPCASMKAQQHDTFAETVALPQDELAIHRERKRMRWLSPAQVDRLLASNERRKKATEGERDE